MTIVQSLDGKFYEIPEDKAASYEVPREKVKDLLQKSGQMPVPTEGPDAGPSGPPPGYGGPSGPGGGNQVIIQVFPNGLHGPSGGPGGPQQQGGAPDGDVEPYWWWRNVRYGPYWRNVWNNW